MTRLIDIVADLDGLDPNGVLHAAKPWSPTSTASVIDGDESPEGLTYLLEIDLARQVIDVWMAWRGSKLPTDVEMCQAVIYYAEHDAYAPVGEG